MSALKNDLLIRVLRNETVERVPVWMMRQAGRYLPEYRALRSKYSFFERCKTPELACEITLQPVRRLELDAAILFSDILVVSQAMGMEVQLKEKTGPILSCPIRRASDLQRLHVPYAQDELSFVMNAIRLTKQELGGRVPLIGFAGAPWTLACYMVQGEGSKTFHEVKRLCYRTPELMHMLLQMITDATIDYLFQQIVAGVDVVQLFDSWAGLLGPKEFASYSMPYIRQILKAIDDKVPVIVFARGAWHSLPLLRESGPSALGLDWATTAFDARQMVGEDIVLQGNLDPSKLYGSVSFIRKETEEMLQSFGLKNYIANLGHGILHDIPLENAEAFVDTVKKFKW